MCYFHHVLCGNWLTLILLFFYRCRVGSLFFISEDVKMNVLKETIITQLRDKHTTRANFRQAAQQLAHILVQQAVEQLATEIFSVQTPLVQTSGKKFVYEPVLIPILRSGLILLPAFQSYFPDASIGIVGLRRDEKTAEAQWYYENVPMINKNTPVIVLDPMIATGGTAVEALTMLEKKGVKQECITFVAVICSPEGIDLVRKKFPKVTLVVAVTDEKLNNAKFILPGLGDFGDRYFGTE